MYLMLKQTHFLLGGPYKDLNTQIRKKKICIYFKLAE